MKEIDLKEKAKQLPLCPGVYLMKDDLDNIIYVGKSKALRRRVGSYFSGSKKPPKVMRMVRSINDFEVYYTDTELEALLLECRLIKKLKPLYNKLLKQDHRYRYIYLNPEEKRPRLRLVREKDEKKGLYFGPYDKGHHLYEGMELLNRMHQLPNCKPSEIKENCLSYKRNQCIGPCKIPYDEKSFNAQLEKVIDFLEGKENDLIQSYEEQMQEAALTLAFERAQTLKEEWQLLKGLQSKKEVVELAKENQLSIFKLDVPIEALSKTEINSNDAAFSGIQIEKLLTDMYLKDEMIQSGMLWHTKEMTAEMKHCQKLFMMQSYKIVYRTILPETTSEKEQLIQEILRMYSEMSMEVETCVDKARMDEIYILHGCLKTIEKENKIVISLAPKEKVEEALLYEGLSQLVKNI